MDLPWRPAVDLNQEAAPSLEDFIITRRQGLLGVILGLFGSKLSASEPVGSDPLTKPETLRDAIPVRFASDIGNGPASSGVAGLYLSSGIEYHRLLSLGSNSTYNLFFWKIDHRTFERSDIRSYSGRYSVSTSEAGDQLVVLDIAYQELLSGGDANDHVLVFMRSGNERYFLRQSAFQPMAFDIRENGTLGHSEDYLFSVTLDSPFGVEPWDGRAAPPIDDLPNELRELVEGKPLVMTITQVDEITQIEPFIESRQVMCTLSLGERDGLYMNMPVYSPDGSGKQLKGWVWRMDPVNCRAGIEYEVGADGEITCRPEVGDLLTSKAPSA